MNARVNLSSFPSLPPFHSLSFSLYAGARTAGQTFYGSSNLEATTSPPRANEPTDFVMIPPQRRERRYGVSERERGRGGWHQGHHCWQGTVRIVISWNIEAVLG